MRYLFLFLVLLLVGCIKIQENQVNESVLVNHPELNKEVTANIGDHLVDKGLLVNETVLIVKTPVDGVSTGEYVQTGDDKEWFFFKPTDGVPRSIYFALAIKKKNDGYLYRIVDSAGAYMKYKTDFEIKKRVSAKSNSFQQTLIFNGIVDNKLKLGYREFKDGMARPAFNNEAEYDLRASMIIGYKGAKIEVIKADNVNITYKLIKNFD